MVNGNGNGGVRTFGKIIGQVPIAAWIFLLTQAAAVTVWAIRLDGRVRQNEARLEQIFHEGTTKGNANEIRLNNLIEREMTVEKRLDTLLHDGTNKSNILEQRMLNLIERMSKVEQLQQEGRQAVNSFTLSISKLEDSVKRLEEQESRMLQALDAQYNSLNDHLRSHGGGGVPRR